MKKTKGLSQKYQEKVVILIDEYDAPIVHYLPDNIQKAEENRDIFKSFYACVKGLDNYIHFFFLTGITQFSRMSLCCNGFWANMQRLRMGGQMIMF